MHGLQDITRFQHDDFTYFPLPIRLQEFHHKGPRNAFLTSLRFANPKATSDRVVKLKSLDNQTWEVKNLVKGECQYTDSLLCAVSKPNSL